VSREHPLARPMARQGMRQFFRKNESRYIPEDSYPQAGDEWESWLAKINEKLCTLVRM